jgi:tetratricopeptide (TPR) repeat protein
LQVTPSTDHPQRCQLRERLADAYERTGRYTEAEAIYRDLLPGAADTLSRAQLHRKLAGIRHQRGELEACADECWMALELLGERRPRTAAGERLALGWGLLIHLAWRTLPWLPRVVRSESRRQRVREICQLYYLVSAAYFFFAPEHFGVASIRLANAAERAGTPDELEIGYRSLCIIYNTLTLYRSALGYLERWRNVARRGAHDYGLAAADVYESVVRYAAGEWASSAAVMDRARPVLMRGGDMFELALGESHRVLSVTAWGDYRGAVAAVNDVLGFVDRMGASQGVAKFLAIQRGMATALLGSLEEGTREVRLTLETARRQRDVLVILYGLMYLGRIQLLAGDIDEAIRSLEELRALERRHPMPRQYFLDALAHLVEARAARLGGLTGAERRRELRTLRRDAGTLERLARRRPGYHASAHLTLGRAAAAAGKVRRAYHHFTKGIEIARRLGAEHIGSELQLEAGRLARVMGDTGASASHLEAALASSRARGMQPFVRRIEAAMSST